jgi:glycerate-2-kinase
MIKNRETLLAHGNVAGRKVVLDILEAGLKAPDPYEQTLKVVRREGNKLIINPELSYTHLPAPLVYNLRQINNIYVVGGGKAAQKEAQALEDLLGDFITEGQINTKKGDPVLCKKINVTLAGHPIPDEDSVAGAQRILEIEQKAQEGDLVFFCTSGGGTALKALPAPGISLKDLQEVYKILYFSCGASMPEANAVRNLLTLVRGKHAKNIKGATVFELQTTESPLYLRGPLFERPNHLNAYEKAIGVLKHYQCWEVVPESVRTYLLKRDPRFLPPTPEEWQQRPYYRFRVAGPELMIEAAREKAELMGLNTAVLATSLNDIEARPVAEVLAQTTLRDHLWW